MSTHFLPCGVSTTRPKKLTGIMNSGRAFSHGLPYRSHSSGSSCCSPFKIFWAKIPYSYLIPEQFRIGYVNGRHRACGQSLQKTYSHYCRTLSDCSVNCAKLPLAMSHCAICLRTLANLNRASLMTLPTEHKCYTWSCQLCVFKNHEAQQSKKWAKHIMYTPLGHGSSEQSIQNYV